MAAAERNGIPKMSDINIKAQNQTLIRLCRTEFARHKVDCSEVQVSASYGVIMLNGKVRAIRGHEESFTTDVQGLLKSLRQRPGIRDVVTNWNGPTL